MFGEQRVQNVGQKTENRNQVFDMHGNVAEWTWDVYDENAYAARLIACADMADCQTEPVRQMAFVMSPL